MRGETQFELTLKNCYFDFNPLPSCEERLIALTNAGWSKDISIHSPHARGDVFNRPFDDSDHISIHSPHARGDPADLALFKSLGVISIHSPHARGDSINFQRIHRI